MWGADCITASVPSAKIELDIISTSIPFSLVRPGFDSPQVHQHVYLRAKTGSYFRQLNIPGTRKGAGGPVMVSIASNSA